MRSRIVAFVLSTAASTFTLVTAIVTDFTRDYIQFSILVGFPIGLLVATIPAEYVAVGLRASASETHRHRAVAVGWFGVASLAGFVAFGAVTPT